MFRVNRLRLNKVQTPTRRIEDMNRVRVCSLSLLLMLTIGVPATVKAQSVQRLFSTPAARAELDRRRFQQSQPVTEITQPLVVPIIEVPLVTDDAEEIVYSLGGTMQKSDGGYTVWINNIVYDQTNLPENMQLLTPFSRGQLRIRDTRSGRNYDVKPGQVLNLSTGQLYESYQYQAALAATAAETAAAALETPAASDSGSAIIDSAAVQAVIELSQDL